MAAYARLECTKKATGARPLTATSTTGPDFVRSIVAEDVKQGRNGGRVVTRFPPEPNGYLHIGHAKSICLNFGIAREFGGVCNLRFDDTNPSSEEAEYVDGIKEDVRWLGFDFQGREYYASDHFERLYELAVKLVRDGKAYVDSLSAEEMREYRGTLTEPGTDSPWRGRCVDENLDLFRRMREGEFAEGAHVLRAKIDMASPNINLRDPVMYRILKAPHHRTGRAWSIYPTYDFAHGQSDSLEGVTHSICTLEFEDHRPLYNWFLEHLGIFPSRQYEFARLNLTHTVLSKRKLLQVVTDGHVSGWDDPRMPTLVGMRRRGYPPEAIRDLCDRVGVARRENTVDFALLEHCVRDRLNRTAPRAMAVLDPLRVVIDNYPEGLVEQMDAVNNPEDPSAGTRTVPFSRELYVERDDFREDPPSKFYRLAPGREVRLRYSYIVKCVDVVKDPATGEVIELRCTYDPDTKSGSPGANRRVRGTVHWVSALHSVGAEVRLYDHLFTREDPDDTEADLDFTSNLNPDSLRVLRGCRLEPSLAAGACGERYQFERLGYFCVDKDSTPGNPVFNRTVTLRDTWARIERTIQGR